MSSDTTERPAVPGEMCSCGDAAVIVYATQAFGEVAYCGRELKSAPANPVVELEDYRVTMARTALAEYEAARADSSTGHGEEPNWPYWCGRFRVVVGNLLELAEQQAARS